MKNLFVILFLINLTFLARVYAQEVPIIYPLTSENLDKALQLEISPEYGAFISEAGKERIKAITIAGAGERKNRILFYINNALRFHIAFTENGTESWLIIKEEGYRREFVTIPENKQRLLKQLIQSVLLVCQDESPEYVEAFASMYIFIHEKPMEWWYTETVPD